MIKKQGKLRMTTPHQLGKFRGVDQIYQIEMRYCDDRLTMNVDYPDQI